MFALSKSAFPGGGRWLACETDEAHNKILFFASAKIFKKRHTKYFYLN